MGYWKGQDFASIGKPVADHGGCSDHAVLRASMTFVLMSMLICMFCVFVCVYVCVCE